MDKQYTIRRAWPGDAVAVSALLAASYARFMETAYDPALLRDALPLIVRANPPLLHSGTYFVAVAEDGTVVGCGGWTRGRPDSGTEQLAVGHIRHFATHPDWAGRGVGRALYDRAAAEARAVGITRFEAHASLNAEPFYGALGFRRVHAIDVPLTQRVAFPAILMEKDLDAD